MEGYWPPISKPMWAELQVTKHSGRAGPNPTDNAGEWILARYRVQLISALTLVAFRQIHAVAFHWAENTENRVYILPGLAPYQPVSLPSGAVRRKEKLKQKAYWCSSA